jgi:hypothetical protein
MKAESLGTRTPKLSYSYSPVQHWKFGTSDRYTSDSLFGMCPQNPARSHAIAGTARSQACLQKKTLVESKVYNTLKQLQY